MSKTFRPFVDEVEHCIVTGGSSFFSNYYIMAQRLQKQQKQQRPQRSQSLETLTEDMSHMIFAYLSLVDLLSLRMIGNREVKNLVDVELFRQHRKRVKMHAPDVDACIRDLMWEELSKLEQTAKGYMRDVVRAVKGFKKIERSYPNLLLPDLPDLDMRENIKSRLINVANYIEGDVENDRYGSGLTKDDIRDLRQYFLYKCWLLKLDPNSTWGQDHPEKLLVATNYKLNRLTTELAKINPAYNIYQDSTDPPGKSQFEESMPVGMIYCRRWNIDGLIIEANVQAEYWKEHQIHIFIQIGTEKIRLISGRVPAGLLSKDIHRVLMYMDKFQLNS
jgi:hypothetical protein